MRPGAELLDAVRRRLPPEVAVVGLLAGAVALGGCASPPAEARGDAAGSKAHVLDVSRGLLARLDAAGSFAKPPRGGWSGCDDLGGRVLFHVTGRLDPAPGQRGALVAALRARLSAAGVRLRRVGADEDPLTLQGSHDGVLVQVTGYATSPMVLLDLSGPCLEVGHHDDELLDEPPERLDLG